MNIEKNIFALPIILRVLYVRAKGYTYVEFVLSENRHSTREVRKVSLSFFVLLLLSARKRRFGFCVSQFYPRGIFVRRRLKRTERRKIIWNAVKYVKSEFIKGARGVARNSLSSCVSLNNRGVLGNTENRILALPADRAILRRELGRSASRDITNFADKSLAVQARDRISGSSSVWSRGKG